MNALVVDAVVRRGAFTLEAQLSAGPGERVGVVGPNGSGKSTLLRAIAGLEALSSGRITLSGRTLADHSVDLPPQQRNIGVVFQDSRLFRHLDVRDNVAFGPRSRGRSRKEARAVADEWLERLEAADLADRRPGELSGGQIQRVALARALAQQPQALLLDEPTAALDAGARVEVRAELRRHLAGLEIPAVIVTHDPIEALAMTDRLVVLEKGRVAQTGTPHEIAARPLTSYVARLLGLNLYAGRVAGDRVLLDAGGELVPRAVPPADRVLVTIPPAAIAVHLRRPEGSSPRNVWSARVVALEPGRESVRLRLRGAPDAMVDLTPAAVATLGLAAGVDVWLSVKASETDCYAAAGGRGA
jgi:molybdate transport system ATP-binding protein